MSNDTDKSLDHIIEVETLLNAQLHDGQAQVKPIMGKILGTHPEFRPLAQEVGKKIGAMVGKVAKLSKEEIENRLNELAPKAVEKHEAKKEKQAEQRRQQKKEMTELPNAIKGDFRVRYAPDPSKYPHLGQGIAYLINRIFADKYDGEVFLRFDDTNPYIVKPEYYEAIKEGLTWLGAHWDHEVRASSHIEEFYQKTREFINNEDFYVCFCDGETKKELSENFEICEHREHSKDQNLEYFEKMINGEYEPGDAIVRLIGDMESDNPVMRDPIMLRLVDQQHPMLEKMYHVFPTYDFESSYFEATLKITHVLRSGEFGTMRQELQSYLIEKLGGTVPEFVQFGRVNIQGCPTKGRVIRQLVEEEVVKGWDDIRLITLQGLQNRGIHPQTPRLIVQEAGLTPQNTQIAWTTIEARSRQLLEPNSKRFFFVQDPVKVEVQGNYLNEISYPYHPDHLNWGERSFNIGNTFYIPKEDAKNYKEGDVFRLKDLFNVRVTNYSQDTITAEFDGDEIITEMDKIQWVTENFIEGTLKVPEMLEDEKGNINKNSLYEIKGYFETNIESIENNEVVQLERVGFAKLSVNDNVKGHIVHLY